MITIAKQSMWHNNGSFYPLGCGIFSIPFPGQWYPFSLLRIRRWHWCKPEKWDNSFSQWCNCRILSDGRLLFFSIIVNFSNKNLGWCIFLEYYLLVISHYFLVFSPSLNAYISIGVIFLNRLHRSNCFTKRCHYAITTSFCKEIKKGLSHTI